MSALPNVACPKCGKIMVPAPALPVEVVLTTDGPKRSPTHACDCDWCVRAWVDAKGLISYVYLFPEHRNFVRNFDHPDCICGEMWEDTRGAACSVHKEEKP